MDKFSKYNQKNDGNRAERTKSARSRRYARIANPRPKTPIFQMLTVSNVPSDVLNALDEIAARQDRSRSSFVRLELQRVVAGYGATAAQ
jgi:hypothetical protein